MLLSSVSCFLIRLQDFNSSDSDDDGDAEDNIDDDDDDGDNEAYCLLLSDEVARL